MKYSVLKIDGEEYRLAYDFNQLADAEPVVQCNLLSAIENLGGQLTATQLRGLLYAAIQSAPYQELEKDPAKALRQVGALIRMDTILPITLALGEAFALAVSEEYAAAFRAATSPTPEAEPDVSEGISVAE